MTITLQPGDYVHTSGLAEFYYRRVAEAFMAAGAKQGEYPNLNDLCDCPRFGWAKGTDRLYHGDTAFEDGRRLTVAQVLGATNAKPPEPAEPEAGVPIEPSVEWDGEGLPPVGTRCQAKHMDQETTFEVNVIHYHEGRVWLHLVRAMVESHRVWIAHDVEFSLVKSEEDLAVEAMHAVIDDADADTADNVFRLLYRAGYRKPEDA